MSLALKEGVVLPPELAMAFAIASVFDEFKAMGCKCVITSGIDGKHSAGSLHYVGLALDFRIRDVPADERERLRSKIAANLGPGFDFIIENDHYHLEYQPKKPVNA